MNSGLLLWVNHLAGKSASSDGIMVFAAVYLIYIVFAVAAACLGICAYKREWRPVAYFCIAILVSVIVLKLVELINFDHRPFMDYKLTQLIAHDPGQSFPSNHTTSSAAIAFGILFFTRFRKIGILLLAAAVTIGFSRIFVGVHYPADIAGGLLTAFIGCGMVAVAKHVVDSKLQDASSGSRE